MATITNLKFAIDSSWNGAGVKAAQGDLKLLQQDLRRIQNTKIKVDVDLDDRRAIEKMRKFDNDMRNRGVQVKLDVDTAHAEAQIALVTRDRHMDVHVDTHGAVAQLGQISDGFSSASEQSIKFGGQASMAMRWAKLGAMGFIASLVIMPGLITTIGGLLTAGLGGAFIAVAAIALHNNEQLQASFNRLKDQGIEVVKRSAAGMLQPMIAGLDDVLFHVRGLEPAFTQAFSSASKAIKPLVDGVMHLVENAMPGVNKALANIEPVFNGLQRGMENFGSEMGRMFEGMSVGAQGLGASLDVTFTQVGTLMANFGVAAGQMADKGAMMWDGFLGGLNSMVSGYLDGMVKMVNANGTVYSDFMRTFGDSVGTILRDLLPVIGDLAASVGETLVPVMKDLIPPLSTLISEFLTGFQPVMQAVSPLVIALADGLGTILKWAAPMAPIIGTVVAVWKLWTIAQWAWNAAFMASGIGAFLVVVGLIISGIVYLATKTQFFQKLWEGVKVVVGAIWQWMQRTWDSFINGIVTIWQTQSTNLKNIWNAVWTGIKFAAQAIWDYVTFMWNNTVGRIITVFDTGARILREAWTNFWGWIRDLVVGIWDWIKNKWNDFWTGVRIIWDTFKMYLEAAWNVFWSWIRDFVGGIWNWIKQRWDDFWTGIRIIWETWSNMMRAAWNTLWTWIRDFASGLWQWITDRWNGFWDAIGQRWTNFRNWLSDTWTNTWNWVRDFASGVWDGIVNKFNEIKDKVASIIQGMVDKVRDIWNTITGIFNDPVEKVKGIWNSVAGTFGLPKFAEGGEVSGYATGGAVFGAGTATSDSIPAMLSNGEHVWTAREVDAAGGHDAVHSMRREVMSGKRGRLPEYASGGPVEWMWARVQEMQPSMSLTSSYRDTSDFHGQGKAVDVSNGTDTTPQMETLTRQIHDTWGKDTLELIHSPSPFNIKNGSNVGDGYGFYGAGTMGQHRNHVHWAVPHPLDGRSGAAVPGGGSGGMSYGPSPEQVSKHKEASEAIKRLVDETNATTSSLTYGFGKITANSNANIAEERMRRINTYGMHAPAGDTHGAGTLGVGKGSLAKLDEALASASAGGFGAVGGEVPTGERMEIIKAAMRATSTPPPSSENAWLAGMNTLITRESNWNPNAINNWDSNAAAGNSSRGLAQVIPTTFESNKAPGLNNIWGKVDNVAASINYIKRRYGTIENVQQANANMPPAGYAGGTSNAAAGWHLVGESGPEMVQFKGGETVKTFDEIIASLKSAATEEGREVSNKVVNELKALIARIGDLGGGITIEINIDGAQDATAVVESIKAQLVPQLEMLLRQGVGARF